MDLWTIVGTVASLLGLALGVWVLVVAKGARAAARDVRAWSRRRNLSEELLQAKRNIEQVGDFLHKKSGWLPEFGLRKS
jgi:hypothetical protein